MLDGLQGLEVIDILRLIIASFPLFYQPQGFSPRTILRLIFFEESGPRAKALRLCR